MSKDANIVKFDRTERQLLIHVIISFMKKSADELIFWEKNYSLMFPALLSKIDTESEFCNAMDLLKIMKEGAENGVH